ncbi:hypothetical protein CC85DRAFT_305890 [Cutaneotrichosporon oleaginosum]|uniref:Uncharacterized protein n=1 Tax=Cutaneotrichosporon oleaginosum TaxID=879819 RepID=A0A0J1AT87_9TREE|nr:uncharacterized protein CC85DRAFT_305890 [Cutaneotrichosporon oleaginosum]KLT38529.1 hypothetical protein CC85DRAFT_305890 [Cutaneotrichosporon oleaginosum]TXT14692.1 hypothetical protein COLE_00885 [Cutaneotrichosporon oleaginosum]
MSLTQNQARVLWDAGGFAVLLGVARGAEAGLDGTMHVVGAFAGYKFVPPGLHALVWGAGEGSSEGAAAALPLRSALIKHWGSRERVVLTLPEGGGEVESMTLEEAGLRALDPRLASYPFAGLDEWKRLTACISREVADVLPGVVDSFTPVEGEQDEVEAALRDVGREGEGGAEGHRKTIRLPVFDLKRSWRAGAPAEDVTRWSRDKSDLWARVCGAHGGPRALLGHTALAYILFAQVWNAPALGAYRRLVALQCRAHAALAEPELFADAFGSGDMAGNAQDARETALAFVELLVAQIGSLPEHAAVEVPDLEEFFEGEIEALRRGLGAALAVRGWWGLAKRAQAAWSQLRAVAAKRGWSIDTLPQGDEEEDEEEGEYAPVVVET